MSVVAAYSVNTNNTYMYWRRRTQMQSIQKHPKDLLVYFQPLENTWQLRTKYEHFEPQIAGKNKNNEFEQNFTGY